MPLPFHSETLSKPLRGLMNHFARQRGWKAEFEPYSLAAQWGISLVV
jgi:hypothetical protein